MNRVRSTILVHTVLVLLAAATLVPFLWMISASLMRTGEAGAFPPPFLPAHPTLAHYADLFNRLNLWTYIANSAILSVAVTAISLVVNSMAGYAFAKFAFKWRDGIFKLLLTAMIIPAQVTMLPLFLLLNKMGLINTYAGVIIPGIASIFGIFLVRQYAASIPDSLLDAARIDGASDFRIYRSLVLPLCKPVLITLAIFTFMGTWNDFLWPLIVLTDDSMYTLPVALASLTGEHVQDTELMMAGAVITVLPVVAVFVALQKYYIDGIMAGGVKE